MNVAVSARTWAAAGLFGARAAVHGNEGVTAPLKLRAKSGPETLLSLIDSGVLIRHAACGPTTTIGGAVAAAIPKRARLPCYRALSTCGPPRFERLPARDRVA